MTRDEMQRFLDLAAIQGLGELEAYRNLVQVIGISFHRRNTDAGDQEKSERERNPKSGD